MESCAIAWLVTSFFLIYSDGQTVTVAGPDPNPVRIGATTTFTCTFTPGAGQTATAVDWSYDGASGPYVLLATDCSEFGTVLAEYSGYTFAKTCDLANNQFTIGVPVTASDITRQWGCTVKVDTGSPPTEVYATAITEKGDEDDGLSEAETAGIAVGAVAGVALIGVGVGLLWYFKFRGRGEKRVESGKPLNDRKAHGDTPGNPMSKKRPLPQIQTTMRKQDLDLETRPLPPAPGRVILPPVDRASEDVIDETRRQKKKRRKNRVRSDDDDE